MRLSTGQFPWEMAKWVAIDQLPERAFNELWVILAVRAAAIIRNWPSLPTVMRWVKSASTLADKLINLLRKFHTKGKTWKVEINLNWITISEINPRIHQRGKPGRRPQESRGRVGQLLAFVQHGVRQINVERSHCNVEKREAANINTLFDLL